MLKEGLETESDFSALVNLPRHERIFFLKTRRLALCRMLENPTEKKMCAPESKSLENSEQRCQVTI
jgi:hypothetical protein